jgi:hypothetical protein
VMNLFKGMIGMERFRKARDRGSTWLLERQRLNGGLDAYYKGLTALQVGGHSHAANRLCNWILTHEVTPEGDFGRGPREAKDDRYIYRNSWVIIGAHRLGRFDLSQKAMDFLMGFWDSQSGGFYSSPTQREADTKQDLMVVGFCGLAALYTGRMEVARAAGRWMRTIMEAQPHFPQKLYTVYSRAEGLHIVPDSDENLRYVVSSDAMRDQFFFQPGIAGGFLARLFQATGEQEWLDLAKEYMRFAEGANDYLFRLLRAGKVGWAAAVLYTLTGEKRYKKMAMRVGDNLIAAQSKQGYWNELAAERPSNDITAEMVVWLDEIYQAG